MSGIVMMMYKVVVLFGSLYMCICDMWKIMFGMWMLEKYVVCVGGGYNYCFGLYDGVMLKDNYIVYVGFILDVVVKVRE